MDGVRVEVKLRTTLNDRPWQLLRIFGWLEDIFVSVIPPVCISAYKMSAGRENHIKSSNSECENRRGPEELTEVSAWTVDDLLYC